MKSAVSILVTDDDTFELGDGWGAKRPTCIQIVDPLGRVGATLTFASPDQLDGMASALTALSLDLRLRDLDEITDFHGSEGRDQ